MKTDQLIPLGHIVMRVFELHAKNKGSCLYKTTVGAADVAAALSHSVPAKAGYYDVALDVMRNLLDQGFLLKVGDGEFKKGDTDCFLSPNVVFDRDQTDKKESPASRGLSNNWSEAMFEIQDLVCGDLFNRYSVNATLSALNFVLISQTWKERHLPDDMRHGFQETEIHPWLCDAFTEMSEGIDVFQIAPIPAGL